MRFSSLFAIAITLGASMVSAAAVSQPAPVMDVSVFQAKALNASLASAPYVPTREDYDTDEEFIMTYLDWEEWHNDEYLGDKDSSSSSAADWDDDWDEDFRILQPRSYIKPGSPHKHVNMSEYYRLPQPRPKPTTIKPLAHQYPYWTPTKCFGGEIDEAERALARAKFAERILRNSKDGRGASFGAKVGGPRRVWRESVGRTLYYACACKPAAAIDYDWHISLEDFDRMEEFVVQDCGTQLGRAYNIEKQIKIGVALTVPWWDSRRLCHDACTSFSSQGRHVNVEFLDRWKKGNVETGPEEGWEYTGHASSDGQ